MKRIFFTLTVIATMALSAIASPEKSASDLCRRVLGDKSKIFRFEQLKDSLDVDRYSVESSKGKILIKGNSANSMAVGLNQYLVRLCHTSVSWWANDEVVLPKVMPMPQEKMQGRAVCKSRFFLNYCTFGYTMPYWKWNDWERFIDWMALNGINMPLAITGQETIWLKVWKKIGLAETDIKN